MHYDSNGSMPIRTERVDEETLGRCGSPCAARGRELDPFGPNLGADPSLAEIALLDACRVRVRLGLGLGQIARSNWVGQKPAAPVTP
jgi:hypothetical protein